MLTVPEHEVEQAAAPFVRESAHLVEREAEDHGVEEKHRGPYDREDCPAGMRSKVLKRYDQSRRIDSQ